MNGGGAATEVDPWQFTLAPTSASQTDGVKIKGEDDITSGFVQDDIGEIIHFQFCAGDDIMHLCDNSLRSSSWNPFHC